MTQMKRPPAGTVTFLFSDIEGSTPLWEDHRQSMEVALLRHDVILRLAIETHNGYVFKTVGDAFCAAFNRAYDALMAAIEAQQRLTKETWPADIARLQVRMGLHSGAAVERAGDYFGPAVNRAARVEAAGHGGQIIVTHAVEQLLVGELPEGVTLVDLGEHRLKGISAAERLYQVAAAGLARNFPPLHTLDPQRTNLPDDTTEFFGRENELEYLVNLIGGHHARLVTLTGPGGVGKTALALHVAAHLIPHFPDGVYQVLLAPLSEGAAMPAAVAAVIGARETPDKPLSETVRDTLRPKRLLLFMDNFEHIALAADLLSDWLSMAPGLSVLATSRSSLRLRSEQEFPLQPLPVPAGGEGLETLRQDAAVALFMARARAVHPELALTVDNMNIVAAICRRLEGLPLAIELAAARTRMLPLPELLRRLDSALPLLSGGPRDIPERHRSLRATIDWSYRLLTLEEQRTLRMLGVFRGGFTLDAVAAISELHTTLDALDRLEPLASQSLIHLDNAGGEPRYTMLETVREYAVEELSAAGESDQVTGRHLAYYTSLAKRQRVAWRSGDYQTWFNLLDSERDNLRTALQRAFASPRTPEIAEEGAWLAGYLWPFWLFGNSIDEARRSLRQALMTVSWVCPARAKVLVAAGIFDWQVGDYAAAEPWLYEGMDIWRTIGYPEELADAIHMTGHLEFDRQRFEPARALFQESLDLYKSQHNETQTATLTADLGLVAMHTGEYELAESYYQEALEHYRRRDAPEALSDVLYRLGDLYRLRGDIDGAQALFQDSLNRIRPFNYKLGIACGLHKLAQVARIKAQPQVASQNLREALALQSEVSNKQGIVECLAALGGLALDEGQSEIAVRLLASAGALLAELGAPLSPPDRDQFLRDESAARQIMGEDAFESMQKPAERLTWEQAVELGLRG